ncbi:MAG TPA: M23 family metallopeptidase [Beijerinckiaceae bacterium]|nr:M23 family metallopeptidase [Beijerinckiaceae bacterium]
MPRAASSLTIDLGFEPPLAVSGQSSEAPARRRVNGRWLAAIVLTGLAGMALMFAAATSTMEHRGSEVHQPQMIKPREHASQLAGELTIAARRADRLVQRADIIAARQTFKLPVTRRGPGGDVIRAASFTRIASPLALESLGFADAVPSFNVARLIADASEDRALEDAPPGNLDADVALQNRSLDDWAGGPQAPNLLGDDESRSQVQEALTAARRTAPTLPAQMLLAKAMRSPSELAAVNSFAAPGKEPFSRLVVRMVPENVTALPRLEAALARNQIEQRAVTIRPDENAETLFRNLGVSPSQTRDILRNLVRGGQQLDVGRRLRLVFQALAPGQAKALVRVDLYNEEARIGSVGRRDDGVFVPIESPRAAPEVRRAGDDDSEQEGGFTLFQSLHETARKHAIPKPMIDEMVRVLFFDVDLQRGVRGGDSFEILIGNDEAEQPTELMMLSLSIGGEVRKFYRFPLPDDEVVDYFDDQGRSAKKFLIRKPVTEGELRSTFGNRRHPILGYWRMHNGVDWAARNGTPIMAAGNGTVRLADWDSGYGRRVEIVHTNGYVTTYSHLSAFGRGIKEGARVRQGQVIGYIGSSGLSTGPHLHYEVMINERYVDPLAIKLPRGRELEGAALAEFKRMREQTDSILKRAPGSAASLATAPPPQTARP